VPHPNFEGAADFLRRHRRAISMPTLVVVLVLANIGVFIVYIPTDDAQVSAVVINDEDVGSLPGKIYPIEKPAKKEEKKTKSEPYGIRVVSTRILTENEHGFILAKLGASSVPRAERGNLTENEVNDAITKAKCEHHRVELLKISRCESSWDPSECDYKTGEHCGLTQVSKRNALRLGYKPSDRHDRVFSLAMSCDLLDEPGGGRLAHWFATKGCYDYGPRGENGWSFLKTKSNIL